MRIGSVQARQRCQSVEAHPAPARAMVGSLREVEVEVVEVEVEAPVRQVGMAR